MPSLASTVARPRKVEGRHSVAQADPLTSAKEGPASKGLDVHSRTQPAKSETPWTLETCRVKG